VSDWWSNSGAVDEIKFFLSWPASELFTVVCGKKRKLSYVLLFWAFEE